MVKHNILVIDDDPLILNTLRSRLGGRTTEVFTAANPNQAREILEKLTPELVLLDLLLTAEDGSQGIIDFMKSEPRLQHVPILVLTNLDKPELKKIMLAQGVKEYLIKGTLSLDSIYDKVLGYLEPPAKK